MHSTPLSVSLIHGSHSHKYIIWLFQILIAMFRHKFKRKKKRTKRDENESFNIWQNIIQNSFLDILLLALPLSTICSYTIYNIKAQHVA